LLRLATVPNRPSIRQSHHQAEYGPALGGDSEAIAAGCERFITRQVFGTRPKEEWRQDVGAR